MSTSDPKIIAQDKAAAQARVDAWDTPERRALVARMRHWPSASSDDIVAMGLIEMQEAMDSLSPSAPDNGRIMDPFHAGCCILRAYAYIREIKDRLEQEPAHDPIGT